MSDHEPPEIGVIGEQDELPKGTVPVVKEPGVLEKKVVKPVTKGAKTVGGGIKKGVPWAAGIGSLAGLGGLIYWLGWGEGGRGIWAGEGPLSKDVSGTQEIKNPYDPQVIVDNLSDAYEKGGMDSPELQIPLINNANHIDNPSVQMLAAEAGGPGWMLPVEIVDGKPVLPDNTDNIAKELASQLVGVSAQDIKNNWLDWYNNPTEFLNFLQGHGADPQVIEFYRLAIDLKAKNPDAPWQERFEPLNNWEPKPEIEATPQGSAEESKTVSRVHDGSIEIEEPPENFFSVAEMVWEKVGGYDFGEALGTIETAAHMDFSNPEFQTALALDIADTVEARPQLSGFSPLPTVLTGLFLLRISPRIGLLSLPRRTVAAISDGIENVYYWFRMGQAARAVRDLIVIGNQFLKRKKVRPSE